MYRRILIPTEQAHSIELPREFYGTKVEVIAFPLEEETAHIEANKVDIDDFYEGINLDFSDFKFDRDEANER